GSVPACAVARRRGPGYPRRNSLGASGLRREGQGSPEGEDVRLLLRRGGERGWPCGAREAQRVAPRGSQAGVVYGRCDRRNSVPLSVVQALTEQAERAEAVSPQSRGLMGTPVLAAAGGAIQLIPAMFVAASVTFIVGVAIYVAIDAARWSRYKSC